MLKAKGLEYEVAGGGEPVLLIHGALVAGAMLPLMHEPALADRHQLIRYHRRGHAGSDPLSGAFSLDQTVEDALALLGHLGVERAHVVGHSGGGAIAVQLAMLAPAAVHSLAVLEPAIMPEEARAAFVEGADPILAAYRSGDVAGALDLWMGAVNAPDWRSAVADALPGAAEQAEKDAGTFFEVELPTLREWGFDADRARAIPQPVLYVLGADSGPVFEAASRYFQSLIPHTETVVLPGLDHLMQVGDPKRVAEVVADFLGRHPF